MRPTRARVKPHRIAYFISPHGFGHAARAAGVMGALHDRDPSIHFDIFTRVPGWFFQESLRGSFTHHSVLTDIGLVQITPLREDLCETQRSLDAFLPFDQSLVFDLSKQTKTNRCDLVLCDIAPLGIAVAVETGLPSVLIENFTWDWIYEEYANRNPRMGGHIEYLRVLFGQADYHVQAEPVCNPGDADLTTSPISRKSRTPGHVIRRLLGVPEHCRLVMITMGGTPQSYPFWEQLSQQQEIVFIARVAEPPGKRDDRLLLLPYRSDFFHPDLVHACDAVIGKVGYSTVAEVYQAGIPFGYVTRPAFRESSILAAYIEKHMKGRAMRESEFLAGRWLQWLPDLLASSRGISPEVNGAEQVADFVLRLL